jgi:hypothetical protein
MGQNGVDMDGLQVEWLFIPLRRQLGMNFNVKSILGSGLRVVVQV